MIRAKGQSLRDALEEMIRQGHANDRLPPERELADTYGVCRATVAQALRDMERDGYIIKRVGKGTFIAPRDKEVICDNPAPRTQGDLLFAYPDFFSHHIWKCVHLAELLALKNNFHLTNLKLQEHTDFELVFQIMSAAKNLRGCLLIAPPQRFGPQLLARLNDVGVPVVFVGVLPDILLYPNLHIVSFNHMKSGYLKMDCLLRHGHRHIGYVANEPPSTSQREQVRGLKKALYEHGLRWKQIRRTTLPMEHWQDSIESGYRMTCELVRKYPELTAIMYDTMSGAIGGLRALRDCGLSCPEDISVVSANAQNGIESMLCPRQTLVVSDEAKLIETSFDMILSPARAQQQVLVDVALLEQESVIPCRHSGRVSRKSKSVNPSF